MEGDTTTAPPSQNRATVADSSDLGEEDGDANLLFLAFFLSSPSLLTVLFFF